MMHSTGCFAIFVKTPGLSPVKTRLATRIGADRAEQFHRSAAYAVASVCGRLAPEGYDTLFAVAERNATSASMWNSLPTIAQPEGDLGVRMAGVFAELRRRYKNVFLIGADIPQLESRHICAMTKWIEASESARFAVAPSEDGGFWCVGGNADIALPVWTEVQYSQATTLQEFSRRLAQQGELRLFDCLRDVDELPDLSAVAQALTQLPFPTAEQTALGRLLQSWNLN